jgi:two-component sensor histidine kinase
MARQTLASSPSPQDFTEKFVRRIDALGRTHSLLSREQWGSVQLCEVARESLEPYILEDKNRVMLSGPPVALDPKSALALGMVFHELATNAIKHGALSNRDGKVAMAIKEALESRGIEVWVDKDQLQGGDEFERRIQRYVNTCSLFMPLISETTESRDDGFFRLRLCPRHVHKTMYLRRHLLERTPR